MECCSNERIFRSSLSNPFGDGRFLGNSGSLLAGSPSSDPDVVIDVEMKGKPAGCDPRRDGEDILTGPAPTVLVFRAEEILRPALPRLVREAASLRAWNARRFGHTFQGRWHCHEVISIYWAGVRRGYPFHGIAGRGQGCWRGPF